MLFLVLANLTGAMQSLTCPFRRFVESALTASALVFRRGSIRPTLVRSPRLCLRLPLPLWNPSYCPVLRLLSAEPVLLILS